MNDKLKLKGRYKIKTFEKGVLVKESDWISNLIMLGTGTGLYLILDRMLGNETYTTEITSARIGDDATAPTLADTDLGNAIVSDIPIAQRQRTADDTILFSFFINDSELPNDDYEEFGIFAGTQLFARSIIDPTYSKSAGQDTQIDYEISAS